MIRDIVRKKRDTIFTQDTLAFLRDGAGEPREFLDEHHAAYVEHVKDPELRLLSMLRPVMDAAVPGIDGQVSRLVRTNRFRSDPVTLRGMLWITFQHRASPPFEGRPGFFFELRPDGYRMGMGFYHASPRTMDRIRQAIDRGPARFLRIIAPLQRFGGVRRPVCA